MYEGQSTNHSSRFSLSILGVVKFGGRRSYPLSCLKSFNMNLYVKETGFGKNPSPSYFSWHKFRNEMVWDLAASELLKMKFVVGYKRHSQMNNRHNVSIISVSLLPSVCFTSFCSLGVSFPTLTL